MSSSGVQKIIASCQSQSTSVAPAQRESVTYQYLQRLAALAALLGISPLLLMLVIAIMLESPGNPFYWQYRVGKQGKRFRFFKLRSMYHKNDKRRVDDSAIVSDRDGVCKKARLDPRVTRIGRIIRKYSLDELPQLWNVVRGDMVLIGPRPPLVSEVNQFPHYALKRFTVTPGITGLWQVSGRADLSFQQQIELDNRYVEGKGLLLDITILFKTIPAVLVSRGAY